MRADARRNREAVLTASRDLFTRIGPDVPMETIADAAGVGVGTIYRHFADRQALVRAVALDTMLGIAALAASTRVAFDDDPPSAWDIFFDGLASSGLPVLLPSFIPLVVDGAVFDEALRATRDAVVTDVSAVLALAQEAQLVRADLTIGEVMLFLASSLRPLPGLPGELHSRLAARRLPLVKAALAPDGTRLPGGAVQPDELFGIIDPG